MNATPPVPASLAGVAARPGQHLNALDSPVKIGVDGLNFFYGPKRALDGISMIVLTAAVVLPMIQKAGFDLIWFGIFIVLLVEIAEREKAEDALR